MRRVNRWHAPRWIRLWMLCATRGGDGWLWYAMGAVILLFGGPGRFRAVGAAALAAASGIAIFLSLKKATGRRRPCAIRAALLGHAAASRSILVPFRPHHYGLRGSSVPQPLESRSGCRPAVLRRQHRRLADCIGYALPQRRPRRSRHRRSSSLHCHLYRPVMLLKRRACVRRRQTTSATPMPISANVEGSGEPSSTLKIR